MRHARPRAPIATVSLAALVACSSPRTLEEAATEAPECARCHGFPPANATHASVAPAAPVCATCHASTVGPGGELVAGGTHENGRIDVTLPHPVPFVAAHTPAALADIQSCAACHGGDYAGGYTGVSCNGCHAGIAASAPDWKTNCTWCHGTRTANVTTALPRAAPPEAVGADGDQTSANPKVGAHQAHLQDGPLATALPCASCHAVPAPAEALTHFTGGGAPGAITFGPLATKGVADAAYAGGTCNVYCHGAGAEFTNPPGTRSPAWTAPDVACGTCHGLPPTSGPRIEGLSAHVFHVFEEGVDCATCHPTPPGRRDLHVDGAKDVLVTPDRSGLVPIAGWDCVTCHRLLDVTAVVAAPLQGSPRPR